MQLSRKKLFASYQTISTSPCAIETAVSHYLRGSPSNSIGSRLLWIWRDHGFELTWRTRLTWKSHSANISLTTGTTQHCLHGNQDDSRYHRGNVGPSSLGRDRYDQPRTVSQNPATTKGPLLQQIQEERFAMVLSRVSAPAPSMAHPILGPRPAPFTYPVN